MNNLELWEDIQNKVIKNNYKSYVDQDSDVYFNAMKLCLQDEKYRWERFMEFFLYYFQINDIFLKKDPTLVTPTSNVHEHILVLENYVDDLSKTIFRDKKNIRKVWFQYWSGIFKSLISEEDLYQRMENYLNLSHTERMSKYLDISYKNLSKEKDVEKRYVEQLETDLKTTIEVLEKLLENNNDQEALIEAKFLVKRFNNLK